MGSCWLGRPEVADLLAGVLNHSLQNDRYDLLAWVIMPKSRPCCALAATGRHAQYVLAQLEILFRDGN